MAHFLGVDIGTFESKAVITDETGRILARARRAHDMIVPGPGRAEHRADEDWWGDFVHVTRDLLARTGIDPASIAAVATSAIGPCMLPVDRDFRPLMNGILYGVDTRAGTEIADLHAAIGQDVVEARCGNALTSQMVGPKILWLRRNRPDLWARTAHVGTSTTWLTWRLTGEWVIDHYTACNFAPLYDIDRQDWCLDLADICTRDHLPRLLWSTQIAGHVTPAAAAETGLAPGTPVTCGTIDAASEAISVGLRHEGDMMLMYGSTVFIIEMTRSRIRDGRLWQAPWLFAGEHAVMAGLSTSGTLTQWFRELTLPDMDRTAAFATLAQEAQSVPPGARGLICLPYFSGERTPLHDPTAKGVYFGLTLAHGRAEMFRATCEGIAMATRHITETYAEAGVPPARVLAVGGGVGNPAWAQATSDLTGLPQEVRRVTFGASYGDAFLAALSVGAVTRADIDRWNPADRVITPRHVPEYDRLYPIYRELHARNRDLMERL
ncbi:MAG: FGGY-family carbohydrate kinase [Rubellimicrobium sp.]|nr:FGGY-family carbohydrate kinase [Rubellimicrobium sp.]